ncbi:MAG: hypothetical protein C0392_04655 [Syntrophus sp. (in: bacteria)]|nr:hypothetical protein [Syntrophus sp. (in: bacteria)]
MNRPAASSKESFALNQGKKQEVTIMKLFHRSRGKDQDALSQWIIGELQSLEALLPDGEEKKRVQKHLQDATTGELYFKDILSLEKILFSLYPEEVLRRKAWLVRDRFASAAGADKYKAYMATNPPDPEKADKQKILADIEALLDQVYGCYIFQAEWIKKMAEQRRWVSLSALGFYIIILYLLLFSSAKWCDLLIVLMMGAGIMGALISILRRMQSSEKTVFLDKDPNLELMNFRYGTTGFVIALVSGAIFPLLLYIIFAAKLVTGILFPEIKLIPDELKAATPFYSIGRFIDNVGPVTSVDFAKMVVWSFVAGFAERFVPDMLDRVVQQAQKMGAQKPAP